jgi:hypothetical protein
MDTTARQYWLRAIVVTALVYVVVGLTTAALSRSASSAQMRTLWRRAAWGISALAFAGHIGGVPAFLVAYVAAAVLGRKDQRTTQAAS